MNQDIQRTASPDLPAGRAPARVMTFVVLGVPATKKNSQRMARSKRTGKMFPLKSKAAERWERTALRQLRQQRGLPPTGVPLRVAPERGLLQMRALVYRAADVGDLLNFLAAVSDALERAFVIENDKQIVSVDGSRQLLDPSNPRVEIELSELAPGPMQQADLFA